MQQDDSFQVLFGSQSIWRLYRVSFLLLPAFLHQKTERRKIATSNLTLSKGCAKTVRWLFADRPTS